MQEAHILSLIEIETEDSRPLIAALTNTAEKFPERAEPLIELADHVEFDDPASAIQYLERALEREFDGFTVTSLLDLYVATKRHGNVIALAERSLKSGELDAEEREQAQEQLHQARTALAVRPDAAVSVQAPAQGVSQLYAGVLLLVFLLLMAILVVMT